MNQNYQDFSDLNLNDPLVQKIMAYLKSKMNLGGQMNNMNNMNMNGMNFNNMYNNNNMNLMYNNMNAMNPGQMDLMTFQRIWNYMWSDIYNRLSAYNFQRNNMNFNSNMNNINFNNNICNNNNIYNNNNLNFNRNINFNNGNNFNNNYNNNMNYNNNNVGNNRINFNNNNTTTYTNNKFKILLPREDKTEYETNIKNNNNNIINIALKASSGLQIIIATSVNTTIEELLKIYVKKIQLPESVINNDIVFLFDGEKLEAHSKVEVGNMFTNGAIITVIDVGGIIGG
jgi:hypothetical protein